MYLYIYINTKMYIILIILISINISYEFKINRLLVNNLSNKIHLFKKMSLNYYSIDYSIFYNKTINKNITKDDSLYEECVSEYDYYSGKFLYNSK